MSKTKVLNGRPSFLLKFTRFFVFYLIWMGDLETWQMNVNARCKMLFVEATWLISFFCFVIGIDCFFFFLRAYVIMQFLGVGALLPISSFCWCNKNLFFFLCLMKGCVSARKFAPINIVVWQSQSVLNIICILSNLDKL